MPKRQVKTKCVLAVAIDSVWPERVYDEAQMLAYTWRWIAGYCSR